VRSISSSSLFLLRAVRDLDLYRFVKNISLLFHYIKPCHRITIIAKTLIYIERSIVPIPS